MKPLHLAAIVATLLLVWTGVSSLQRPQPRPDAAAKKKGQTSKAPQARARCTIKHAVFGGTESALLKVTKGHIVHYVVLDLPTDNPRISDYQSSWLEASYGSAEPTLLGVFPSVEAAVTRAASLCRSN